ncbi:MAG: permease-like cell division protein FtsX [Gammaproteobacteria bacterium]|nr:permease-like cell division protein FtsX [Gammaproteobacteria bacterium]
MSNKRSAARLNPFSNWLRCHGRACLYAMHEMVHAPFATLMTLAVIGIAMALPSSLYVFLKNVQNLEPVLKGRPTISLYLNANTNPLRQRMLISQLKNNPAVQRVRYISPQEGLDQFKKITHFEAALSALNHNPLPGVIIVTPSEKIITPVALVSLAKQLSTLNTVSSTQVDMAWVKRLYYILTLSRRITYAIAFLFGCGVILIVGNTIRLSMQKHREEISILKLIGAKPAFIRRPLLYRGLFYGVLGGYIAWILISLIVWWLKTPADLLAKTYGNRFFIQNLNALTSLSIIGICGLLGFIGSWLVLRQHLNAPENQAQ